MANVFSSEEEKDTAKQTKSSATVCRASLLFFDTSISDQSKQDVLYSTLLAQLVASKKADPYKNPVEWYSQYRNALEMLGWLISSLDFSQRNREQIRVQIVEEAILALLSTICKNQEVESVKQMLTAVRNLSESDRARTLWEKRTHTSNAALLQIGYVQEISGGLNIKLGTACFTTENNITDLLTFSLSGKTEWFEAASGDFACSTETLAMIRQSMIDKLGRVVKDEIAEVQL